MPPMDTVLLSTRLRCLHASPYHSPAIYQICRSRAQFSCRPSNMTMNSRLGGYRTLRYRFPGNANRRPAMRRGFYVAASTEQSSFPSSRNLIVAHSVVVVALAVANRVLYKLALVPMREYPFFMAQLNTFGYVLIYFTILFTRYRLGIVTNEMISVPKWRFVIIGFLEALGVASGMAAAAMLPGPVIPILNQTFLVWQLLFSVLILGKRFWLNQITGCLLVVVGIVVAVSSGSGADHTLSGVGFLWPAIMVASAAFQAGASITKEYIFKDAVKRLKGKSLDIFVVNSFGSGFQALFVFLLLPFLSNLKGIPIANLLSYLKAGAGCFLNAGAKITAGCDGAPLLPLLYIATNLAFNISLLHLVKISSAIVSSLAVMLSVPISVYIMSKSLPYLPGATSLSSYFVMGSIVLVLGLLLYNIPITPNKQDTKIC